MAEAASIAAHLPYLRRFARALVGSQAGGDSYAIATLEAIIEHQNESPGTDPGDANPDIRVGLYRTFLQIWDSVPLNRQQDLPPAAEAAGRKLDRMTPLARVAFLLQAMEGFSTARVASTLQLSEAEAEGLIERAGQEMAEQIRTSVLIIEDEPIIAMDLEALVQDLGHQVTHIARTHAEAVAASRDQKPGLVLADIQLADGSSGLDAVNEILSAYEVPVVFITAYPERLLTGERPEPAFLLSKPFRNETVKAIISQALFFDRKARIAKPAAAAG